MTIRTPEEIVARIEEVKGDDFLGFRRQVLVMALPYDVAAESNLVREGVTKEQWDESTVHGEEATTKEALEYLEFAFGKADDHRGISANRSVEKMGEYAWLLCRDDVVTAMENAEYAQYGVPVLVQFAEHLSDESRAVWARVKNERLERMAVGLPCETECYEGCG